jgi:hypothetical protein
VPTSSALSPQLRWWPHPQPCAPCPTLAILAWNVRQIQPAQTCGDWVRRVAEPVGSDGNKTEGECLPLTPLQPHPGYPKSTPNGRVCRWSRLNRQKKTHTCVVQKHAHANLDRLRFDSPIPDQAERQTPPVFVPTPATQGSRITKSACCG